MKPDKPGEWHSRDGRRVVVYTTGGGVLACFHLNKSFCPFNLRSLDGDDWLPAIAPTFPALPPKPPKPPQVLLRAHGQARWYTVEGDRIRWMKGYDYLSNLPDDLKIIPHDENDDEAIKRIQEAQRETR